MVRKTSNIIAIMFAILILYGSAGANAQEKKDTGSDIWLEAQLVTSYTLNEHLNPFTLDVNVQDGVAELSGTVDSEIERDLAVEIARSVKGIKEVRENLTIEPEAAMKEKKEKNAFVKGVEDATLTAKVKYRLILNKNIASYDINVDTDEKVVTLTGKVDSELKRDLAVKLAENTSGVEKVMDNLTVVGEEEIKKEKDGSSFKEKMNELSRDMQDTWITTKAKSLLMVSNEAEGASYDISTENGNVTVTGTVMSEQQARDIQRTLMDLQGVREVENKLKVREAARTR
jgi:osmotically-inducible protein OsmY